MAFTVVFFERIIIVNDSLIIVSSLRALLEKFYLHAKRAHLYHLSFLLYHLAVRCAMRIALRKRICKNRPNASVIGIRVGLSVVAVQVEVTVVVPVDVEAISGRELTTLEPVCYPYICFTWKEDPSNSPQEGRDISWRDVCLHLLPSRGEVGRGLLTSR